MSEKGGTAVKLQEYATKEQIEFFDQLRSGDDPVHEEARTQLVRLANELLTILAFPIDTAAAAYVARTLLDDPKLKLWTGNRIDRPKNEAGEVDWDGVLTDSEVRIHVVGDSGVMKFYRVLKAIARLLILAGHGDRVIAPDRAITHDDPKSANLAAIHAIDLDAIADPDVKAAVQLVADARGAAVAIAIHRAVTGIAKDDKAKQIELLSKAVLA